MLRFLLRISVGLAAIQFAHLCLGEDEYRQLQELPKQSCRSLSFSPDGSLIASAGQQPNRKGRPVRGHVTLWSVETGKVVFHEGGIPFWMFDVHFSPDGELLAVSCIDRSVWIYRRAFDRRRRMHWQKIKRLPQVHAPPGSQPRAAIDRVRFSPDGSLLAASNQGFRAPAERDPARCVQLWDVETFSEVGVLRGPERNVSCLRFFPDGRKLILGHSYASATVPELPIWDVESQDIVRKLRLDGAATEHVRGSHHPAIDISSDGELIAAGAYAYLALIDAESLEMHQRLVGHEQGIKSVSVSPTQPLLASGGEDKTMRVWNIETGEQLALREMPSWVWGVLFSPDGKTLATIAEEESPRLWDVSRLIKKP